MKTTHLIYYLLFATIIAHGQATTADSIKSTKKLKYEVGFNLYSFTNIGSRNYFLNGYEHSSNFFPGFFVKRYFNKNVFRFSFDYTQKSINKQWTWQNSYLFNIGNQQSTEIRVGYERELSSKRLVPFISTDLSYVYSKKSGISSGNVFVSSTNKYLLKTNQYSLCVGSGLKFKLRENILLTYEFNMQVGYRNTKGCYNNITDIIYSPPSTSYGNFIYRFNPVRQIGISFKF